MLASMYVYKAITPSSNYQCLDIVLYREAPNETVEKHPFDY